MPQNEEVQAFMEKLGSFYEIVDENSPVPKVPKEVHLQNENNIPPEDETNDHTGMSNDSTDDLHRSIHTKRNTDFHPLYRGMTFIFFWFSPSIINDWLLYQLC